MNTAGSIDQPRAKKNTERGAGFRRKILPLLIAGCFACGPALANPGGAQVVNGQVAVSSSGNVLTVTNSPGSIINWQSFSINPGELTQFLQQNAGSSVLNRIVGQNPSQILGALQSNGKVYLVNPNGIVFGSNARVNVGGLVASSLDISNGDFQAGKLNFSGTQAGAVSNQGSITTPGGGQVYLIAPQVQNNGIITSPQGEVLLAAGHSVQLVDGGEPNVQVVISAPADQAVNLGSVVAQGGKIGIYGALVNQNGIVSADSAVVGQNGEIEFKASQTTMLAGNSKTSATGSGTGGSIYLLGPQVGLTGNAQVDASGQAGGGTVLVGGDFHGANAAIENATATYVGTDTVIRADALQNGNGGKVIVWSDNATRSYGNISAQGGTQSGNGGFVENSSGHDLDFRSKVNIGASTGKGGTLLLDPDTITIVGSYGQSGGTDNCTANCVVFGGIGSTTIRESDLESFSGGNILLQAGSYIDVGGTFNANGIAMANNTSLSLQTRNAPSSGDNNALQGIDLTGSTTGTAFAITASGTGSITLQTGMGTPVTTPAPIIAGQLFTSSGSITLNGNHDVTTGQLSSQGGAISVSAGNNVAVERIFTSGGAVTISGGGNVAVSEQISTSPPGTITTTNGANITITSTGGNITLGGENGESAYNIDARGSSNYTPSFSSAGDVTLSAAGTITVSANSAFAGGTQPSTIYANHLGMTAGGGIANETGGSIATQVLGLQASNSSTGDIRISNANTDLAIYSGGIQQLAPSGSIVISTSTANAINVDAPITAKSGAITLAGQSGITLNAGGSIASQGGNITLQSDTMSLSGGTVTTGGSTGTITLAPYTAGTDVNLGCPVSCVSYPGLHLLDADLNAMTGNPNVVIGDAANTANITVQGPLTAGFMQLSLVATGAISQVSGATLPSATSLYLQGSSVDLQEANPTGVIAAKLTGSGGGDFSYHSSQAIQITSLPGVSGTVNGIAGKSGSGSTVFLQTDSTGGITQSSGAVISAPGGELALQSAGPVTLPESNNVGYLTANINGSLAFQNSNLLTIQNNNGMPDLTGIITNGCDVAIYIPGNTLAIVEPIDTTLQGGRGGVTLYVPGNTSGITQHVDDLLQSNAGNVILEAAIVSQGSGGGITANNLGVISAGSINFNAGSNSLSGFAARTTGSGSSISFTDGSDFGITSVIGATSFGPHVLSVSGIGSAADATLTASGISGITVNTSVAGNNVTLQTAGGAIAVNAAVTANGALQVKGGPILVSAPMSAGSGSTLTLDTESTGGIAGSGLLTASAFDLQSTGSGAIGNSTGVLNTSSIGGGSSVATMVIGNASGLPAALYLNHIGGLALNHAGLASDAMVNIAASDSVTVPNLHSTADLTIASGNVLTVPAGITLTGANIVLAADQMTIDSSPSTITAAGMAWLKPFTAGTPISLGAGTLGLAIPAAQLDAFTAGTLRIGSTDNGPIAINAPVSLNAGAVPTLSLMSGGTITQTSGSGITASNLSITALGSVTLDTATNSVGNIAATLGDGAHQNAIFAFKNAPTLTVAGSLDGISGIAIALDGNNFDPINPNGYIALTATAGAIAESNGINISGKALIANGYTGVNLQGSNNPIGVIAGSVVSGDFKYTSMNGIDVAVINGTSGIHAGSGSIVLEADSSSGISQSTGADLATSGELALKTIGPVNLFNSGNNVADLVADLSVGATGTGVFAYKNSGNLAINDSALLGYIGIATNGQNVAIDAGAGDALALTMPITTGGAVGKVILNANSISQSGAGVVTAHGLAVQSVGNITLNSSNAIFGFAAVTTGSGSSIAFTNATGFNITSINSGPALGNIMLPGVTSAGTASLAASSNNIVIGAPITAAGAITLTALSGTISGGAQVTGTSLTAIAANGIGSGTGPSGAINTQVSTLAHVVNSGSGDINIVNDQSVTGGTLNVVDVEQTAGGAGSGNITIVNYGHLLVDVGNQVSTNGGTGSISLSTHSPLDINGTVSTQGPVQLSAGASGNASDTLTLGASAVVQGSTVALDAGGAITVTPGATLSSPNTKSANLNVPPPPSLSQCTATPTLSGCADVLPTLVACTSTPDLPGCSVVLPTIAACTATPTASGCSVVLPTVAQCTSTPTAPGCAVVLPTIAQCTATPTAPGCSIVLPTVAQCTATPAEPGCVAILPTVAQCTSTPTVPGCSAVLPTVAQCTATPTEPGCVAVLPTIAQCTSTPTAPGCTAVLPTVAQCTSTPAASGCSAVLPTIAQCAATPSAAGCNVVLPSLAQCEANPAAAGCNAILPTLAQCETSPSVAGCNVVLPTLAQCMSTPALAGCTVVLPSLSTCVAMPTLAGCAAILPTLAQCTANPALAGCAQVLPPVISTLSTSDTSPVIQANSTIVNTINISTAFITLNSPAQPSSSQSASNQDGTSNGSSNTNAKTSGNSGTASTATTNNGAAKKLYCN